MLLDNQIKEDEMNKACNTNGREKHKVLVRIPEGKRP
jgi:hypothetical protein